MTFGHLGVIAAVRSMNSEPSNRSIPFILLAFAGYVPDILDLSYSLTGICNPFGLYSHTIPAVMLQIAVVCGVAWLVSGSTKITVLFGAVLALHLVPDFFTGYKLWIPGGDLVGLDLYKKPMIDAVLEVVVMAVGWFLLRRSGRGPGWGRSPATLIFFVVAQLLFNATSVQKPSGCEASVLAAADL